MMNQAYQKTPKQLSMTIDGHKVTISFTTESNPNILQLVRNTLLDSYIKKNGISPEGAAEC